jgi:hypothetical protein
MLNANSNPAAGGDHPAPHERPCIALVLERLQETNQSSLFLEASPQSLCSSSSRLRDCQLVALDFWTNITLNRF